MSDSVNYGLPGQHVVFWHAVAPGQYPNFRARSNDFTDLEKARVFVIKLLDKQTNNQLHQQRHVLNVTANFTLKD